MGPEKWEKGQKETKKSGKKANLIENSEKLLAFLAVIPPRYKRAHVHGRRAVVVPLNFQFGSLVVSNLFFI